MPFTSTAVKVNTQVQRSAAARASFGAGALARKNVYAGVEVAPVRKLHLARRGHQWFELCVSRLDVRDHPCEGLRGVQGGAAEKARMQIPAAGRQPRVQADEAAGADLERKDVASPQRSVEDDRGISDRFLRVDPLDDRLAHRLPLRVAEHTQVDR